MFITGLILFVIFQYDEYPLKEYTGKITEINESCYKIIQNPGCPVVCNLCMKNKYEIGDVVKFYGNAFYCPYNFGDGECYEKNVHIDRTFIRYVAICLMLAWVPFCMLNYIFYLLEECWKKIKNMRIVEVPENQDIELVIQTEENSEENSKTDSKIDSKTNLVQ